MARKSVPPSIKETAFNCPHCGAFTTQHWWRVCAESVGKRETPLLPDESFRQMVLSNKGVEPEIKEDALQWLGRMSSGQVFLEKSREGRYIDHDVHNLFVSQCYNCQRAAVWVHDRLLFPSERHGPPPNADLPEDVLHDYEEARTILDLSPRGAAALLRLSIQKLCKFLGEKGKDLDKDIGRLVAKGLNPLVQQSLDVVRVIGNEAVHPGVLDLKDDRDTATNLLSLVNLIADQMITHPKSVQAMYEKLPEGKRAAIAKRDGKATKKPDAET